ncbi:MAG TPA: MauE/DoxX family redox-associated membrane protein [Thermoanaerobaculia bacterium]|nr:MauE/DoxX family redox-associated membrane protein [Thermoanaerobaculia bacterium]
MGPKSAIAPKIAARPRISVRPLGVEPRSRLRFWAGTIGGAALGAVLLVAAWAKAIDPVSFADQVRAEGLADWLPAGAVAMAALALEAGLGMALLLGVRRPWVLVPATLLIASFLVLTGRAYWLATHGVRSEAGSCGCFGNLVERTPAAAFWQDLALLVPLLLLAWTGRQQRGRALARGRTVVVAAFTAAVLLFAWRAPALPLDDLATRLKPGAEIAKLCAGGGDQKACLDSVAPELDRGQHLVVLADLDDPALGAAVRALNAYAAAPGAPTVWMLHGGSEARQRAFFWKWGPAFKVAEAPLKLLRRLYRRLPRSFEVKDGRVTATYAGLPPLPQLPPLAPIAPAARPAGAPAAAAATANNGGR